MQKVISISLFVSWIFIHMAYGQHPQNEYPHIKGLSFGVGLQKTEHVITSFEQGSGTMNNITQTDTATFLVTTLHYVSNGEPWFFKVGADFGFSGNAKAEYRGSSVVRDTTGTRSRRVSQNEDLDYDSGLLIGSVFKLGYNLNLGDSFRIRPVVGGKMDFNSFKLERSGFTGADGFTRASVSADYNYLWLGPTVGIDIDIAITPQTVFYAGGEVFVAMIADREISGSDSFGGGSYSTLSLDGSGLNIHFGFTHVGKNGVGYFIKCYMRYWDADGTQTSSTLFGPITGDYDWEAKAFGVTAGLGVSF
ncbi:MAG: hypothetical protein JJU29_08300 [Verrucomicrobia bacterium]|nr:hypothetical protein [Verrucomicrobiota bacterium]MCH8512112.1 hypothetical protein [Kiritimatiellia bacterium]